MKRLLLILAVAAACMAFAGRAQAQTNVDVPIYSVYYFQQTPPASVLNGGTVTLQFEYTNAGESYPGKLAEDMMNAMMREANVSRFIRVNTFQVVYSDGTGYTAGYLTLTILPSYAVGMANLNFVYQSCTIQNY